MGKKKNKITKISEEEYFAYIAGLKNDGAALFDSAGEMLIPTEFKSEETKENGNGE